MQGGDSRTTPSVGDGSGLPDRDWLDSLGLSLGDWTLTPEVLLNLCREIVTSGLEHVVELGSGTSTAALVALGRDFGLPRLVVSFDQSDEWLDRTRSLLPVGGPELRLVHALLTEAPGRKAAWYDEQVLLASAPARIDLLVVDGPVGEPGLPVREPAPAVLRERLSARSRVILDDCSRPEEAATLERWTSGGGPLAGWGAAPIDAGRAVLLSPQAEERT